MARATLTLTVDEKPLRAALELASSLAERFPKFRDDLVRFLELGDEVGCIHSDDTATVRTRKLFVRLEPSDGLRGLLTTMGAGDV